MTGRTLEKLVKHHARQQASPAKVKKARPEKECRHVKHFDPIDAISHHVVLVIFVSMIFLFMLALYMTGEPTPGSTVSYALFEFEPVTIHKDIATGVSDYLSSVRQSEEKPFLLLFFYTFWIVIFGLINMVLYERSKRK